LKSYFQTQKSYFQTQKSYFQTQKSYFQTQTFHFISVHFISYRPTAINHFLNPSVNQSISEPINQSISQSINPTTKQYVSQSINKSFIPLYESMCSYVPAFLSWQASSRLIALLYNTRRFAAFSNYQGNVYCWYSLYVLYNSLTMALRCSECDTEFTSGMQGMKHMYNQHGISAKNVTNKALIEATRAERREARAISTQKKSIKNKVEMTEYESERLAPCENGDKSKVNCLLCKEVFHKSNVMRHMSCRHNTDEVDISKVKTWVCKLDGDRLRNKMTESVCLFEVLHGDADVKVGADEEKDLDDADSDSSAGAVTTPRQSEQNWKSDHWETQSWKDDAGSTWQSQKQSGWQSGWQTYGSDWQDDYWSDKTYKYRTGGSSAKSTTQWVRIKEVVLLATLKSKKPP